jgi:hypothetical protein
MRWSAGDDRQGPGARMRVVRAVEVLRGRRWRASAIASLLVAAVALAGASRAVAQTIPPRLTDEQFWKLVTGFSEEDGFFRSENFVSNEVTFQHVIPDLVRGRAPGGVYLGVGPDQNFTYIVALRPRIAFIVDIRRGAMLQHLMYKALIEMSRDRAEFLSLLFSRPRPPNVGPSSTPEELIQGMYLAPADSSSYWRNLQAIKDRLTKVHGFSLTPDDFVGIEFIYTSFHLAGPDITYNYGVGRGGFGRSGMPTYAQLILENDGQGVNRSYLASEENFRLLRELHTGNLIVPVIGDFAGPRALRSIGQYVRSHGATVTAIYTSNVEQYLFQGVDDWKRYYESVATLPIDSASTFIRALFSFPGYRPVTPGARSVTVLCSVSEHLKAFTEGRIATYGDIARLTC